MNNPGIKPVNIGYGNIVMANKILAIVAPDSSPIKRLVAELRENGALIDATYGRRTRSVIFLDNGTGVLSSVQPETICARIVRDLNVPEGEDHEHE